MTPTGSESLPGRRVLGPIFRRKAIAATQSDTALISTAPGTGSSGSSTGSNNVVGLQRATTGLPPTTLPSFNSRQSGYGCALMSPRPGSSCPGLTRASTPSFPVATKDVDGRDEPGHDGERHGWARSARCQAGSVTANRAP